MNSMIQLTNGRSRKMAMCTRSKVLWLACAGLLLWPPERAQALFHLWTISEVYSSPDGSVQFVELSNGSSLENQLAGHAITCTGPQGTHSYNFTANLPSTATAGKRLLLGTTNLALVPGGIKPDYVFTNDGPFLFLGAGVTNTSTWASSFDSVGYTNLPSDGVASLVRSGTNLVFAATNSPQNFAGGSNVIVPLKFLSEAPSGTNVLLTFATATGTNNTTGPNYALLYNTNITQTNWTMLTNLTGDGSVKTVADSTVPVRVKFYRLRVP
jgi:hypothetical protein